METLRERLNAERQAASLQSQADKMRAKATKAKAAQSMAKRAEKLLAGVSADRAPDRVARLRFPDPAPSGRVLLRAQGLRKSYGSLRVWDGIDLEVERQSRTVILGQDEEVRRGDTGLQERAAKAEAIEVRAGQSVSINLKR